MAMSNKPSGLVPVGTVTGAAWNEQGNLYAIANDASNTYAIGDVVKTAAGTDSNGIPYVTKATAGDVPVGIIVGFRVADPGGTLAASNINLNVTYLAKSSGERFAYVVDDPNIIFEVQMDSTAVTFANLHKNANLTITADDTTHLASSPLSSTVIDGSSINTTPTLIVRLLGTVQRVDQSYTSATVAGAYVRVRGKFNLHEYGIGADATGSTGFTGA